MSRCSRATEKTFDLTTIMRRRPRADVCFEAQLASQVYYIDLSEPDGVVVYQQKSQNVLSRGAHDSLSATAHAQWWNISNERSYT
ncbi:MAG: hypothetical protein ACLRSD_05765 [Oscillibacter sp.]